MKMRCLGGWAEGVEHVPAIIGEKEPLDDARISDGACDRCCKAMLVKTVCRLCKDVETWNGLCDGCTRGLATKCGEPFLELTVYRAGAEPLTGTYDGAGLVARLRTAMRLSDYCGFALRVLMPAPTGAA